MAWTSASSDPPSSSAVATPPTRSRSSVSASEAAVWPAPSSSPPPPADRVRILLQRVTRAEVRVDGTSRGAIDGGLLALVGIGPGDEEATVATMAGKCVDLRIFRDEEGRTNRSLADVGGAMLVVSQFTLFGD